MSMFWVAVGTAAITGLSAISQGENARQAANQQADAMEYNNQIAEANAAQSAVAANAQEDDQRRKARAVVGTQIAASGEAGAGLNADLLRQSIFDSETDALNIRYEGQLKSAGYTDQAAIGAANSLNTRSQGGRAQSAGYLNAASSILNSGTSYYKYKNPIASGTSKG